MSSFNSKTPASEVVSAFPTALDGATCVVTGASEGSLAAETTYNFAKSPSPPALIVLLGRSSKKLDPVIQKLKQIASGVAVKYVEVDLADLQSVRKASAEVQSIAPVVDLLINSAGIMAVKDYQMSKDGFEMHLAACHLGHFLLAGLLIPHLQRSNNPRVVTLTSMGYESSDFRFDDWNFSDGKAYDPWLAYGQAKTANIMFTTELSRRATASSVPLTALVVHPGLVLESGIMQNTSQADLEAALKETIAAAKAEGREYTPEPLKTLDQGCATIVYAAMAPPLASSSGAFLADCAVYPESNKKLWIKDAEKAAKLWNMSEEWVGVRIL